MIETSARVISTDSGTVLVEPTARSGCSACQARSACGVSGLGKYFSGSRKTIAVQCDDSVRPGDALHLSMSEGDFLKAGMLAYVLPSMLTIIGAGIAAMLGYGDAGAAAGAALGGIGGLLTVRLLAWKPRMTASRENSLFNEGETP